MTGASVLTRSPSGVETHLATPGFAVLEHAASKLGPAELRELADELCGCSDPARADALRERITRGFYGI